jgi:phage-related protein
MDVHTFRTMSGKDCILEYLDTLPFDEMSVGYEILLGLEITGILYLRILDTRKIQGDLWEIKFYRCNRVFYFLANKENIHILHICKKQKGKTEKFELATAISRLKTVQKRIKEE